MVERRVSVSPNKTLDYSSKDENKKTQRPKSRMIRSPGQVLRKVLLFVCFIQVVVTVYLAFCIYNSAFSTLKGIKNLPKLEDRQRYIPPQKEGHQKLILDFDIGKHEADIVLAEQEMSPHEGQEAVVQLGDGEGSGKQVRLRRLPVVELWSKAAIGSYLWHHILEGPESLDDSIQGATVGELQMTAFMLRYRSGPGITPETVPEDVRSLVLVVNGRTDEKVKEARLWLDHLQAQNVPPTTILVMLGNEQCDNGWVTSYLAPKGVVVAVLVTYDDPRVDQHTFHQWPLGVATYRQFPLIKEEQISPEAPRKYMCNLRATIYPNSSRSELYKFLKNSTLTSSQCHIKVRESWVSNESPDAMDEYVQTLLDSDLTLCPAGMNTETYRVYEALGTGSTPVIEAVVTNGHCAASPWRLLKRHDPPVIWVKSWDNLGKVLAKERRYSKQYKALRRLRVFQWYEWFKLRMRDSFVSIVTTSLLQPG
ncbi:hypothetical protein O3P69_017262 [Scylla paramamosain]|uniref:Transmembrane protein 5 n=1 Tax=Scylla paramamosain TaxID=85552 RepID=A0AAW0TV51_SCYPA